MDSFNEIEKWIDSERKKLNEAMDDAEFCRRHGFNIESEHIKAKTIPLRNLVYDFEFRLKELKKELIKQNLIKEDTKN